MKLSMIAAILAATLSLFGVQQTTKYADPAHRFSFDLPRSETIQDLPPAAGSSETLLIQGGADDAQIVIMPWSGNASLSNLETEYPYLSIVSGTITDTSVAGMPALTFSNQVWFADAGYLYVVEDARPIVLSTWRF